METPFHTTMFFPLSKDLKIECVPDDWAVGPYVPGGINRFAPNERISFYANGGTLKEMLSAGSRFHFVKSFTVDHLDIEAVELSLGLSRWSPNFGYLLVHACSENGSSEAQAFGGLAKAVRKTGAEAFLKQLVIETKLAFSSVVTVPRIASLSLSAIPHSSEEGRVRWTGSEPAQSRIVDLLTLPTKLCELGSPYSIGSERPSPSTEVWASGASVAAIRQRMNSHGGKVIRKKDVDELRTFWADAMLLELVRRDAAIKLIVECQQLAKRKVPFRWVLFGRDFRTWRTKSGWQASTDHPVEANIAKQLRREFQTEELLARVEAELTDHSRASTQRATWVLSGLVAVVGVFPVVESVRNLFF